MNPTRWRSRCSVSYEIFEVGVGAAVDLTQKMSDGGGGSGSHFDKRGSTTGEGYRSADNNEGASQCQAARVWTGFHRGGLGRICPQAAAASPAGQFYAHAFIVQTAGHHASHGAINWQGSDKYTPPEPWNKGSGRCLHLSSQNKTRSGLRRYGG
jgi:hypothetical protein